MSAISSCWEAHYDDPRCGPPRDAFSSYRMQVWFGDDGWSGSSEHPSITVQAATFEHAKAEMESAIGEHVRSLLETSMTISKRQAP
jgi:predicted RNase H-like HicB family nuclease